MKSQPVGVVVIRADGERGDLDILKADGVSYKLVFIAEKADIQTGNRYMIYGERK